MWNNFQEKKQPDFSSLKSVFALNAPKIGRSPISDLYYYKDSQGNCFYVKRYTRAGKYLRRFLGRSRIRAEWENLLFFKKMGIPVPEIIAYGESRYFHIFFRRGALITQEVKNAISLKDQYAQKGRGVLVEPQPSCSLAQQTGEGWGIAEFDSLRIITKKIALYTKKLHQLGFIHNDLKWRNILITKDLEVLFIDCPQGRKKRGYFKKRGIVKDLACLDHMALKYLSIKQRLIFSHCYFGVNKLTKPQRCLLAKVVARN